MAAATSMAAALAATLPAPQAAPAPSAPAYEAIPASMAKVIDIEAEIAITSVQLDAMVSYCFMLEDIISPRCAHSGLCAIRIEAKCSERGSQATGRTSTHMSCFSPATRMSACLPRASHGAKLPGLWLHCARADGIVSFPHLSPPGALHPSPFLPPDHLSVV